MLKSSLIFTLILSVFSFAENENEIISKYLDKAKKNIERIISLELPGKETARSIIKETNDRANDLEVELRQYYSRISFEEEQYIEVSAQRANPFGPRKRDYKTFTVTKGSDYQYKFHEISVHSQSNETSYDVTPYKDKDEIPRGVHITALATGPYWNDIKAGHKWLKFTCTVKFVYSDQKIEALLQEKINKFREELDELEY